MTVLSCTGNRFDCRSVGTVGPAVCTVMTAAAAAGSSTSSPTKLGVVVDPGQGRDLGRWHHFVAQIRSCHLRRIAFRNETIIRFSVQGAAILHRPQFSSKNPLRNF